MHVKEEETKVEDYVVETGKGSLLLEKRSETEQDADRRRLASYLERMEEKKNE